MSVDRLVAIPLAHIVVVLGTSPAASQETLPAPNPSEVQANQETTGIKTDVDAAIQKAMKHLQDAKYQEAVAELTAATRRFPDSARLWHLLGVANAQDKQMGQAWLQLRQAVRLDPGYPPAADDFLHLWGTFDEKGVLSMGQTSDEIARLMGEPDHRHGKKKSEVWEYGFMRLQFREGRLFAIVDPRGFDPRNARPLDVLDVEFDDKSRWRLGYRAINHIQSITEYVPQGETVQQWKELYTVQRFYALKGKQTPKQMMQHIEKNLKAALPQAEFQVLTESDTEVLFHWRDRGAKDRTPQHEIVRLVAGKRDIHRLAYARRVPQIPAADANQWIARVRNAQLTAPHGLNDPSRP